MKVLALTPWPIYPATSGGQERCWNLLSNIPEVTIHALDWTGADSWQRIGATNYRTIAADPMARIRAQQLLTSGVTTYDPIPSIVKDDLTNFRKAIDDSDPDLIILEHPWLLDLIDGRPYIYDSHNCETINSRQQRPRALENDLTASLERRATQQAEHMTYTSTQDLTAMRQLYPFTTPTTHIPNGLTLPPQQATGEELNLIFIGSLYGPNIQAAKTLLSLAPLLPEYKIRILGNVCNALTPTSDNVELIGAVTEKQMDYYFKTAHAFINPVTEGSGTSLKIARALSYALPVISTPHGARGYTSPFITSIANIPDMVRSLRKNWKPHSEESYAEALPLQWSLQANKMRGVINGLQ